MVTTEVQVAINSQSLVGENIFLERRFKILVKVIKNLFVFLMYICSDMNDPSQTTCIPLTTLC